MVLNRHIGGLCRRLFMGALCAVSAACATQPVPPSPKPSATVNVPQPVVTPGTPARAVTPECHVAAVGDIMLGGTAAPEMRKFGYDYPFELTKDILKQAQIVFGNLEGPLTDDGASETAKQYVFRSPPDKVAPALSRAGFNIVSLANNHTLDYGPEGLEHTRQALEKAGIQSVGAGANAAEARAAVYMTCAPPRGSGFSAVNFTTQVAFLAYSLTFPEEFWAGKDKPGTAFGHERHVGADVAAAREKADIVVVSFHWGQEGKTELRDYQRQLAHAAIDAGASAVLGHHPHILQGVERYKNGVILYSLGNFAFGSFSNTATRSAIALLTFRDNQWRELRMVPINVKNAEVVFQPRPLVGRDATDVVEHLQQMSQALGTTLESRDGVAVLVAK
ncbi:MAG: CapA family protein [Sulfuricaulis sp.]|uniref:CapA family protein n=1 Tax=Sulfuricaulis sp. TaxID=2003553 RepID=UPI0025CE39B6|nr:CapA family protein [Sulfuricaulis sp.]MCR4345893.1 CapA family protein [Sulfuricaulis sp.]